MRLILSAAVLLTAACAPPPPPDYEAMGKALLARDSAWLASAATGNVETVISYWSDDALVIPPGQPPIEGKAALRAYITEMMKIPGFKITWKSEKPVFSPDGKLAYLRGTNVVTMPGPNAKPMEFDGRGVTVWRLEPDGQWRCTIDIWNEPPPPVAQTKAK
jgi:ketosteroid isomerase-like protein